MAIKTFIAWFILGFFGMSLLAFFAFAVYQTPLFFIASGACLAIALSVVWAIGEISK